MADGDSDCDVLDGHPTMPSNRLSLRLGQLPHAVLAELAARLCSESPALQATANECIAAHISKSGPPMERRPFCEVKTFLWSAATWRAL